MALVRHARSRRWLFLGGILVLCAALISTTLRPARTLAQSTDIAIVLVTSSNLILTTSDTEESEAQITGLQPGERVLAIDARPATNQIYALGSTSRLYTVDTQTGAATLVGTGPLTTTLQGTDFGLDFNPVVDRLRLVSDTGQDLRINPNNGVIGGIDGQLAYAAGDANAGQTPAVVAAAYTNSFPGATSTSLYVIDAARDVLATQGSVNGSPTSPNTGQLFTVGALGIDAANIVAFDIAEDIPIAAITTPANTIEIALIDLTTGRAESSGSLPVVDGETIIGLTLRLGPPMSALPPAPTTPVPGPTAAPTALPAPTTPPAPTTVPVPTPEPLPTLPPTGVDGAPVYFPETGYALGGEFLNFWESHGGLPVFGFPIRSERKVDGQVSQWLERNRFELHAQNKAPYNVLLGHLGVEALAQQGRAWESLPKGNASAPHYYSQTGHAIAPQFWSYWSGHGLEFDGKRGKSEAEALALFGYPVSEAAVETNANGDRVLTQWFERARFEFHPGNPAAYQVLLGRLGAEALER